MACYIHQLRKTAYLISLFFVLLTKQVLAKADDAIKDILIEVPGGRTSETALIAIDRIREYSNAITHIAAYPAGKEVRAKFDLTIIMGVSGEMPELKGQWKNHPSTDDSWLLHAVSEKPLVLFASGINERATLYAAYRLADLIKSGADLGKTALFFEPKVVQRYVSYGTTTHGRRYHQPSLYYKNLKELPRYGYNGVLIYPGGGTPIGRNSSPVLETGEGVLYNTVQNLADWKSWFREVNKYKLDIVMTIPPMVPPGYTKKAIRDYYGGGPQPDGYISA